MKNKVFQKCYTFVVAASALLLIQNSVTAAPLVLPRPVPLQAETIAQLKHAHANENVQWQLVVF